MIKKDLFNMLIKEKEVSEDCVDCIQIQLDEFA